MIFQANLRSMLLILALLFDVTSSHPPLHAQARNSPPMIGIAHVALRVSDLERSRNFYQSLGYDQAFAAEKDGKPTESFLKINDLQFIELYPARAVQPLGFLHVCFQGQDLQSLHDFYVAEGLHPTPVRKAGAGNLLFTMEGPEHQNIEFTQYMPGSRHTLDTGEHLGSSRLSTEISTVALAFTDIPSAAAFYADRLLFPRLRDATDGFALPGNPRQRVILEPYPQQNKAHIFLKIDNVRRTEKSLRKLRIPFTTSNGSITISDPDGNLVTYALR